MESTVKTQLTHIDVIESGACPEGVFEFLEKYLITRPIVNVKTLLKICDEDEKHYIVRAANLDGNGNGYGNGYGNGNGYGYGYGNGNGYGFGYGYGNGNGNGNGNGFGYGNGYGNGFGNGYGFGYGNGKLY